MPHHSFWKLLLASTAFTTTILPSAAHGQEDTALAPQASDAGAPASDDIVVTGSRIARTGFTAPTPVSVIGTQEFERRAYSNVADALNELPAFRATNTPTAGTASTSSAGFNYADLRGLGSTRTLVLVDGRRHVSTATTGQVDLNLIPTLLIERAEAVTGGASAAYGSDAVAGVVNLILKKRIDGLQGEITSGITDKGDGAEYRISLAGGFGFGGGRGSVVLAGEFLDSDGIGDRFSRDWGRRETALITNPTPGVNGMPARIIADNVHLSTMNPGGLITSGPLRGTTFLPDGTVRQYQYGEVFGNLMIGGDGYGINNFQDVMLKVPVKRGVVFGHAEYEFSDAFNLFVEGSYGRSQTRSVNGYSRDQASLTIQRDNAFLPASVAAAMDDAALSSFVMGRFNIDVGPARPFVRNETMRGVIGARGDLGGSWNWDAYYQYGRNDFRNRVFNNRINRNFFNAIDAVFDDDGNIVCRSTLTDPGNGCIPFNPFGNGASEPSDYLTGTSQYDLVTTQHAAAFNIQGEPFSTWAGPVSIATGVEWRRDRADAVADAGSEANIFHVGNLKAIHGEVEVSEIYAEAVVPLARDLPFAHSLELNGAIRRTDYSTSGGVTSWKLGATYEPVDFLRLRATRSRDIRAPNISELFSSSSLGRGAVINPSTGLAPFANIYTLGNPNLKPERATTTSFGVVFSPRSTSLRASVDYFDIRLNDQIGTLGAQGIVDRCFAGAEEFCDLITIDAANNITDVYNSQLNLFQFKTKGVDFEVSYRTGGLSLRLLATHVIDLITIDTAGSVDRAGQVGASGGIPAWTANANLSYETGPITLNGQLRFIGAGRYDRTLIGPDEDGYSPSLKNSIDDNHVPSVAYVNMSVQYDLERAGGPPVQLFAVVNNLFDKDPPPVPTNAQSTQNQIYDVVGRAIKVGFRFKI